MKCAICGKETNWDTSFGKENFIVCNHCFCQLTKDLSITEKVVVLDTLFKISDIKDSTKDE